MLNGLSSTAPTYQPAYGSAEADRGCGAGCERVWQAGEAAALDLSAERRDSAGTDHRMVGPTGNGIAACLSRSGPHGCAPPRNSARGMSAYPAIREKSATLCIVSRMALRSRKRFSRSAGSSALTVTLSKNASTGARRPRQRPHGALEILRLHVLREILGSPVRGSPRGAFSSGWPALVDDARDPAPPS